MAAVDRKDPKKEYLELAAHPANSTPYTPNDDNAKVYKIPIEKSEIVNPGP